MSRQKVGPAPTGPDPIEQEFAEALRGAAFIFEKEKSGRFKGSIMACHAVIRFIKQRGGAAELAGPFVRIAEAFEVLEKGGKPRLFAKKTSADKERERSPERKVIYRLAAAALEVLVILGDELDVAAAVVARAVKKWPGMRKIDVKPISIVNWRKQARRPKNPDREVFETLVNAMLAEPEPRATVEILLKQGPPGHWQS
jgi:hypothetical protein